ncbi:MAG: glucose-1-phosphate adenylyltransferase [Olsenella sp.]|nr:glucose-1-phosphate adenylyltransferase [Bacteroidales bacterium]MBP3885569.1 glucose-1-phosphate adenylyltransferase [Olsenella sp.]
MSKKECIAMLLAGGQGSRLGVLTKNVAKPAVSFGGKYRIIDFALSNCANSGIDTVGVLTQYRPYLLHSYLGTGGAWNLDESDGGVAILPPYATQTGGAWYEGTADAVTQNIGFIEQHDPEYVLILSGDQLYSMDYQKMLDNHKRHNADLTVAVMPVPWEEASRFGIITQDEDERIVKFTEKPDKPDSNLASMGIYIFNAKLLIDTLREDAVDQQSEHDFGNNIIPKLLADGKRLYTYEFNGFWRDVGTIASYHETSMDLLGSNPDFDLYETEAPIMSNAGTMPPAYIGPNGAIEDCLVGNGSSIYGRATHSIISTSAYIGERAVVEDSVLLPGATVKDGAHVVRAILGERATVEEDVVLGSVDETKDTVVIGNDVVVGKGEE